MGPFLFLWPPLIENNASMRRGLPCPRGKRRGGEEECGPFHPLGNAIGGDLMMGREEIKIAHSSFGQKVRVCSGCSSDHFSHTQAEGLGSAQRTALLIQ